jgi:hypothetical protein
MAQTPSLAYLKPEPTAKPGRNQLPKARAQSWAEEVADALEIPASAIVTKAASEANATTRCLNEARGQLSRHASKGFPTTPEVVTIRVYNDDKKIRDSIAETLARTAGIEGFKLLIVVAGQAGGLKPYVHSIAAAPGARALGQKAMQVFNPSEGTLRIFPTAAFTGSTTSASIPTPQTDVAELDLVDPAEVRQIVSAWHRAKCLVIEGAPGVGKTHMSRALAQLLASPHAAEVRTIQFHQSSTYEDFVGGWKPDGQGFKWRTGTIVDFAGQARSAASVPHVLVIDELNRGNVAKIFGEVLTLIEGTKREAAHALLVPSEDGSPAPFHLPDNLYVLGLMNTADRTLATIDFALRRRFLFWRIGSKLGDPSFVEFLESKGVDRATANRLNAGFGATNARIRKSDALGEGFEIGHAYFCVGPEPSQEDEDWYREIFNLQLFPLLREYAAGDGKLLDLLLKDVRPDQLFATPEVDQRAETV